MGQVAFPTFSFEQFFWDQGYEYIIGVDEVGRGSFAGPVVAGASAFSKDCLQDEITKLGIHDSKLLTSKKRESLVDKITSCSLTGVGVVDVPTINSVGIGKASFIAMRKALQLVLSQLEDKKTFLLIDAFLIPNVKGISKRNQQAIIKGDQKSIAIASGSIIAKVYRDSLMSKLAKEFQMYGWEENKGYGTASHRRAITQFGITKYHRRAFIETTLKKHS